MKRRKPLLALLFTLVLAAVIILSLWLVLNTRKYYPEKSVLLKTYEEINEYLISQRDFNALIDYLKSDPERERFLDFTLQRVSYEYSFYHGFEERYPDYKEFLDMEAELARSDFSEWIAGVIRGDIDSPYENNVFTFLKDFGESLYLNQAIDRFFRITESIEQIDEFENYKLAILLLYIEQFPENREFQRRIVQNRNRIYSLGNRGIRTLNANIYYYLSVRHFGISDFITQRISSIRGRPYGVLGNISDRADLDSLVNDFIRQGRGMAQYFYPLFEIAFSDDSFRNYAIYIALRVFREIGYDDPVLRNWLGRNYSSFSLRIANQEQIWEAERERRQAIERDLRARRLGDAIDEWHIPERRSFHELIIRMRAVNTEIADSIIDSINQITTPQPPRANLPSFMPAPPPTVINFQSEVEQTLRAIEGRSASSLSQSLSHSINMITQGGDYFVPPVTVLGEINKEFNDYHHDTRQYNDYDISSAINEYDALLLSSFYINNYLLITIIVLCAFAALAISVAIFFKLDGKLSNADYLLSWLPMPFIGFVIFIYAVNNAAGLRNISGPISIFGLLSFVSVYFIYKRHILKKPGMELYRTILVICGHINFSLKRIPASSFYFNTAERNSIFAEKMMENNNLGDESLSFADMSEEMLDSIIKKFIRSNDLEKVMQIMEEANNKELNTRIVKENNAFFSSADPRRIRKILIDIHAWMDWLKLNGHEDIIRNITII